MKRSTSPNSECVYPGIFIYIEQEPFKNLEIIAFVIVCSYELLILPYFKGVLYFFVRSGD